jgi:hypothetical protein
MSAGREDRAPGSAVRVTVPAIDAARLETLVLANRSTFASSAAGTTPASGTARNRFLQTVFADIESRLDLADERSLPRTEIPKRLAAFQRLAPLFLRAYNYLTKSQREAAVEQTQALRAMLAVLRAVVGDYRD